MSVPRIIDVNANRVREAVRVLEDAARFALNDQPLTDACKQFRHAFTAEMQRFETASFHRDTAGDVGTSLSAAGELHRASIGDVVIAAGKRLGEALRSIEEYAKVYDADVAAQIKKLRYRAYDLVQRFEDRCSAGRSAQWRVCLLLTESLCPDGDWKRVAAAALDNGCDCIQMREKQMDDGALLRRATELRAMTDGRAALIINDRADIAALARADGVHLGQGDLPVADVRRLVGRTLFIGVSAHDMAEADAAVHSGADYLGIGTMFASSVKPNAPNTGPAFLSAVLERHPDVPHLAIGGVTAQNVHELVRAGCRGVAVSSAICTADDPGAVTTALVERISALSHSGP